MTRPYRAPMPGLAKLRAQLSERGITVTDPLNVNPSLYCPECCRVWRVAGIVTKYRICDGCAGPRTDA